MKKFSGRNWDRIGNDTGWRDISSFVSVTPYDPFYAEGASQVSVSCKVRRVNEKVTLMVYTNASPVDPNLPLATFIPAGINNPLVTIGAPTGMAVSDPKVYYLIAGGQTQQNARIRTDYCYVSGTGIDTDPNRNGELRWRGRSGSFSGYTGLSNEVYTLKWMTTQPFPTTFPGVETTL